MSLQSNNGKRQEEWYVMRHFSPELVSQQLQQVNEHRIGNNKPSLVYIIPWLYVREARRDNSQDAAFNKQVEANNVLRNDFRFFVFVKATPEDINQLVHENWNKDGRLHLYFCRSRSGAPLKAKEEEMNLLIRLFVSLREKFNFVPAENDFHLKEKVVLKSGILKNYQLSVTKICYSDEGINLTLSLPLFNGEFNLEVKDYPVADVNVPMRLQKFMSPGFVRSMEQDLIAILRRRVKGRAASREESAESDAETLNTYHFLHYMDFPDAAVGHHMQVLLLLCAALRKDQAMVDSLIPAAEQLLEHGMEPASDEEAFVMAVLFVATHQIEYRSAAKLYEQTHHVASEPLMQLMPVIKNIKVRQNKKADMRLADKK